MNAADPVNPIGSGDDQSAGLRRVSGGGSGGGGGGGGEGGRVVPLVFRQHRVLAVTGGKGGVGKSTVALNLAVSWAKRGARTLAFDGDMGMADLNLLLGLAPARSLFDLVQGAPVEDVLVEAHGIHLLPALNGSFALANLDAGSRSVLMDALERLSEKFDTLVVDTPAGIGENAMALAGAVADVVVVATSEPLSLADAYACLKVLATRHGVERAFLLPNSVRSPSEADEVVRRLTALVDRFLGIQIVPLPAIPYDPAVPQAAAAGQPLVLHSPDGPAARALMKAARRIDALAVADRRSAGLWLRRAFNPDDGRESDSEGGRR